MKKKTLKISLTLITVGLIIGCAGFFTGGWKSPIKIGNMTVNGFSIEFNANNFTPPSSPSAPQAPAAPSVAAVKPVPPEKSVAPEKLMPPSKNGGIHFWPFF